MEPSKTTSMYQVQGEDMEVEEVKDIFGSPQFSNIESEWRESLIMKICDCDIVIKACQLDNGFVLLASKEERLVSFVYSLPEFDLKFVLEFEHYTVCNDLNKFKDEIISSCMISTMFPSLKQIFQEHLEVFDTEIIIVGLVSGLVYWFLANTPNKGPFVLCSLYEQLQGIHFTKDTKSGLHSRLSIILASGRIVVFGQQESFNLCLPESVKTSYSLKQYLVTSNFIDCFASELQLNKEDKPSLNCVSLPLKGVCAMTAIPESDHLLAATIHGSVYVFNPTNLPSTTSTQFVIPSQNLLDNMLVQTQDLEQVYKRLNEEDSIIKAISAAMAANSLPTIFDVSVNVLSDNEFQLTAKLKKTTMVFSHELWLVCVEVLDCQGQKKTLLCKFHQDFSSCYDLTMKVDHRLSIGVTVFVELILLVENQLPVVSVPLDKVEIDACHMMVLKSIVPIETKTSQASFEAIVLNLNNEVPTKELNEFKLLIKLPSSLNSDFLLRKFLQENCQKISDSEWSKISGGNKNNIQVIINNTLVHLTHDTDSCEISIASCDIHLCHCVKESIIKRLANTKSKVFPDSVVSDFQALQQILDIEKLKDNPNILSLESVHKKLRSLVSSNLSV